MSRQLLLKDENEVKFVIFPKSRLVKYLFANMLRVSLKEGAQEFMPLANVEAMKGVKLEDVLMAKLYSDLFPTEIPEPPLVRNVNFYVDLHQRTQLISIAPIRMLPLELSEL